jgi:hypothetical protein
MAMRMLRRAGSDDGLENCLRGLRRRLCRRSRFGFSRLLDFSLTLTGKLAFAEPPSRCNSSPGGLFLLGRGVGFFCRGARNVPPGRGRRGSHRATGAARCGLRLPCGDDQRHEW